MSDLRSELIILSSLLHVTDIKLQQGPSLYLLIYFPFAPSLLHFPCAAILMCQMYLCGFEKCVLVKFFVLNILNIYKWYWITLLFPTSHSFYSTLVFRPSVWLCIHIFFCFQLLWNTAWCAPITFYLSTLPIMDIRLSVNFTTPNSAAVDPLYMATYRSVRQCLWVIYPEEKLLGHSICVV